jgi:SsrA-binding protein
MAAKTPEPKHKLVAENRRARHDYFIEDDLEAGIVLEGSEVKSLRTGKANIAESYATVEGGELWLINGYIPAYAQAKAFAHEERRRRKLLVNRRELARLWQGIGREGMTLVPLKLYFNEKGRAKLQIALAKGKKIHDKREVEKKRDWNREKGRLMRDKG